MTKSKLEGFDHELEFWERFVKSERFLNHWATDEPNPELSPIAIEAILAECGGTPKVLDIGSGPVSILRGLVDDITEVDPLAKEYKKLYPPSRVKKGSAEDLNKLGRFDIVHMSNSFDHTQDPMQALLSMIKACKPGGLVYIQGFVNEAHHQKRAGLHQWDVNLRSWKLVVNGRYHFAYAPENVVVAKVEPFRNKKKHWFHFAFRVPSNL